MKKYIFLILLIFIFNQVKSQDFSRLDGSSAVIVDNIVATSMTTNKLVGVSIGVLKGGNVVYLKGYGFADKELQILADANSMYRLASVSKTITGIAAMQLHEANTLDLTMDIEHTNLLGTNWPSKTVGGNPVTVTSEDLLTNESGLSNFSYSNTVARNQYISKHKWSYNPMDAISIYQSDPLAHVPGTKYLYSTQGFDLMAAVIEKAGTGSYVEQVWDRIADVAEMPFLYPAIPAKMPYYGATARYGLQGGQAMPVKGGDNLATDASQVLGGGGWMASARGFTHLLKSLYDHDLMSSTTRDLMCTDHLPSDANRYGYGVITFGPSSYITHAGELTYDGTQSVYWLNLSNGDGVVVLINTDNLSGTGHRANDIANLILGEFGSLTIAGAAYTNPIPTTLNAPSLNSPSHNSSGHNTCVQFNWQSIDYCDKYIYEYADNNSFLNSVIDTVQSSSVYLNNLDENTSYYWRIKAINEYLYGGTESNWTSVQAFSTTSQSSINTLPFFEGFENLHTQVFVNEPHLLTGNGYNWAYENSNSAGRLKSGIWSVNTITGDGSLSLDAFMVDDYESNNGGIYATNYLILTIDLSNYTSANNLILSFDLRHHHEESHAEDKVWIRGSSTDSWLTIYDWFSKRTAVGATQSVEGLDIDALLAANSQVPSKTFQVRFGQRDNNPIFSNSGNDGLTLDNIEIKESNIIYYTGGAPIYGFWNESGNWSTGSVPTASDAVVIPAGTPKTCFLHTSTSVKDLTINAGATIFLGYGASNGTLTVLGDCSIFGEIYESSFGSKIILKGSSKQVFRNNQTINHLEVNNSNGIELSSDLTIKDLTLVSGHLDIGDHDLTLTGTIGAGNPSSYIRLSGTGKVKATVGNSPVIFPIGRNPYLPVIIDDGGNAEYSIGVADELYPDPTNQINPISNNCVSESWTIQSSTPVSNVSLQFGWDAAEEETGFNRSASAISYWENSVNNTWQLGATGSATGSGPYFQTTTLPSMTTNLYYFGIGNGGSALPVELTYFDVIWQKKEQKAVLNWQTATEENNSHLIIQRSFDLSSWEKIGRIEGEGNSIQSTNYNFTDHLSEEVASYSTIYYRLKQVDFNGDSEHSDIRTIHIADVDKAALMVYPNPIKGNQIQLNQIGDYRLYNSNGLLLLKVKNTNTILYDSFSAGVYFIQNQNGENVRFIKR